MKKTPPVAGQPAKIDPARRFCLRWAAWSGLALLASPLLTACSVASEPRRFAIFITGPRVVEFAPSSLTIPLGGTVVWKNQDLVPHTVTCDPALLPQGSPQNWALLPEGARPWDSGDLYRGESWAYTFTVPGNYIYFSRRGSLADLLGNITVTG